MAMLLVATTAAGVAGRGRWVCSSFRATACHFASLHPADGVPRLPADRRLSVALLSRKKQSAKLPTLDAWAAPRSRARDHLRHRAISPPGETSGFAAPDCSGCALIGQPIVWRSPRKPGNDPCPPRNRYAQTPHANLCAASENSPPRANPSTWNRLIATSLATGVQNRPPDAFRCSSD
jgi:hypothetical protein